MRTQAFCLCAALLSLVPVVFLSGLFANEQKPSPDVKSVLIKIDRGAYAGNDPCSLGFGMPLREGQCKGLNELRIVDGGNTPVPAAFEMRTRWDDGSVQWLWTDFRGKPGGDHYLVIGADQQAREEGLAVQTKGDEIVVNNGVHEWAWNKRFATPTRLSAVSGDARKGIFQVENARARGDGVYLIDQDDRRAALAGKDSELEWKVETANSLRAVIRVEGWYATAKGDKIARAVLRYHLHWLDPTMRVEHRFIVTRDNDEVWYKEVGFRLPLKNTGRAEALLGKKDGVHAAKLAAGDEAYIYQRSYPVYSRLKEYHCLIGKKTGGEAARELEDCKEAGGWAALHNGEAGLAMAMKDFAQQFPKEFSVSTDGLTLKLWSGRDGKALDYKPATLARDWWKDWLSRLDFNVTNETSKGYFEKIGITPETIASGAYNPSCVGVSKIHEFSVRYDSGESNAAQTETWAKTACLPPVAYADPRWITRVDARVLPTLSYKGEGGEKYESLERYISVWFDKYMEPLQLFSYAGWYEWGKGRNLTYERLPDGRIYAGFRRVNLLNFYGCSKHMLYAWLRSGNRKYLDQAQRMIRMIANYRVIQWGGGKLGKTRGHALSEGAAFPVYWQGKGSVAFPAMSPEDYEGAAFLEYYLRDSRFRRDDIELRAEAVERDYAPGWDHDKVLCPTKNMYTWAEMYRLTRKPIFKKFAAQIFDTYTDLNQPFGLNAQYYAKNLWSYEGPSYKLNRKLMWLTMYADWSGEEKARKVVMKAFLEGGVGSAPSTSTRKEHSYFYSPGPEGYKNFLGYVAARLHDWTGDRKMLEHIEWQLSWLQKTWAAFEALPESERGLEGTASRIRGPISAGHSEPVAYVFKDIVIPRRDPLNPWASLAFDSHNNGVPFLAVPGGIWAMCGASYDYTKSPQ